MNADSEHPRLLLRLSELLESGLQTDWQERAYSSEAVNKLVARLQEVAADDYSAKLRIAGFTAEPYWHPDDPELEQSCATCMYFERNRRFCDLPELALPVLAKWSCVLWRI